jgi:hypothetical protein
MVALGMLADASNPGIMTVEDLLTMPIDASPQPTPTETALRRGLQLPPGLDRVLALIVLDLLIHQVAWHWWLWPTSAPEQSVFRHVPFALAALLLWLVSPLAAVTIPSRYFRSYAEGVPEFVRIGVVMLLVVLLLVTGYTLIDAAMRYASENWL